MLKDKCAVITGASRGIGKAIAIKFANQIGNFTKRFIIDPIKGLFE